MDWGELEKLDSTGMKEAILLQGESVKQSIKESYKVILEIAGSVKFKNILMTGAGDKYLIPMISEYLWEHFSEIPIKTLHARTLADNPPKWVGRNTLAILLSQSGTTKDTLDAMELCLSRGSTCVAITNRWERPSGRSLLDLEEEGGFVVRTRTKPYPEKPLPSTGTFHATLALLNILLLELLAFSQRDAEIEKALELQTKTIPDLIDKLSKSDKVLEWGKSAAEWGFKYVDKMFYVMGDGPRYPIARKHALIMLMEGVKADACDVRMEEFVHSLIETLEEENRDKKPLIILKPPNQAKSLKTSQFIKHLWMRHAGTEKILEVSPQEIDEKIPFPDGIIENFLSPPLYAVPLEWQAFYLALLRRVDPGVSKLVGKVRSMDTLSKIGM
ncbi:MAG: SIS domain-containing protein [Candidatus Jordarchaeales archaeon]